MRLAAFAAVCLLASVTSIDAERRAPRIVTEIIGSFPGAQNTEPFAINNRGQVVGRAGPFPEGDIAFIWSRRTGFQVIAQPAAAVDINERGEVVGRWLTCPGGCTHGFIWSEDDGFRDLGPNFFVSSINNRGDLAGDCPSDGLLKACRFRDGVLEIAPCEGSCAGGTAGSINARGDVAGTTDDFSLFSNAFLWMRDGSFGILNPGPSAPSATIVAQGRHINNRGVVSGVSGAGRPAIWIRGRMMSLTGVGTGAGSAVNNRGWVVGTADGFNRAYFWDPHHNSFAFLTDGPSEATDINDRGEIVGWIGFSTRTAVIWRVR